MNKNIILLVFLFISSSTLFAQQTGSKNEQSRVKEEGKTVFNPHWLLSVQRFCPVFLAKKIMGPINKSCIYMHLFH